jgi:hypothetical protein
MSIQERIATRSFPSTFQAWAPAQNLNNGPGAKVPLPSMESQEQTMARHDLIFTGWRAFGLQTTASHEGLAKNFTPASITRALARRNRLLSLNPHMILLAEVRYYDARDGYLPSDSPWWKRDRSGNRISNTQGAASSGIAYSYSYLDYSNPQLQRQVADQCQSLVKTGVFDGCMLDWWGREDADRINLIQLVRAAAGGQAILIVNTNGNIPERSAPYINGMFMEGYGAPWFGTWQKTVSNLTWAQTHLQAPVITALEGWYKNSRDDYPIMRQITTMSLVFSNGYVLFGDPNPLPTADHLHDFYPFWNKRLGRPAGAMGQAGPSGSFIREYENGSAVFNPPSNRSVEISFPEPRLRASTGERASSFQIDPGDGDLFLNIGRSL